MLKFSGLWKQEHLVTAVSMKLSIYIRHIVSDGTVDGGGSLSRVSFYSNGGAQEAPEVLI